MLKEAIFTYLVVSCISIGLSGSILTPYKLYSYDFKGNDVFQIVEMNTYDPSWNKRMQNLNDFLVDRTDSTDPNENFDITLEELILNYKNAVGPSKAIEAKRLFLALSTLNEENECSYYGFLVLDNNLRSMDPSIRSVIRNENLRRIEKILVHFINRHINNCREVYFKRFDEISKNLDPIKMERLNFLLEKPIKHLVSDERQTNQDKTYVERLFDVTTDSVSSQFEVASSHVYDTMIELVKGDADERFVRKVENERTGVPCIRNDKLYKLFQKYIAEPCAYYRQQLGPDVFEPALFDGMFDRYVEADRVDFYESWCKYRFCKQIQGAFGRVLSHGNQQDAAKS